MPSGPINLERYMENIRIITVLNRYNYTEVEDIYKFNIDPIIAFGSGKYRNYEQKLKNVA